LLVNDEGHDKMRDIILEQKRKFRGPTAKLDATEEKALKEVAFQAGCTSCVCLVTKDTIFCANSGDSRAVIGTKSGKVIELSYDHKPENTEETRRVKAGGGYIEDGRVQGVIAVSRAIGDWEYKDPDLLKQLEKKGVPKKRKSVRG